MLTPMSSYYVDILHSRSAETLAASGYVLFLPVMLFLTTF